MIDKVGLIQRAVDNSDNVSLFISLRSHCMCMKIDGWDCHFDASA